jgi:hypothetical protein
MSSRARLSVEVFQVDLGDPLLAQAELPGRQQRERALAGACGEPLGVLALQAGGQAAAPATSGRLLMSMAVNGGESDRGNRSERAQGVG